MKKEMTIEDVLTRLMLSNDEDHVALANQLLAFRIVETRRVGTAATDGIVILCNPDFIAMQTFKQCAGLLLHELLHPMLHHNERFSDSPWMDHPKANRNMDREINPIVRDAGFDLPNDGCWPDDLNMNDHLLWETYYAADTDEAAQTSSVVVWQRSSGSGDKDDAKATSGGTGDPDASDDGDQSGDSSDIDDGVHAVGSFVDEFAPDLTDEESDDVAQTIADLAKELSQQVKDAFSGSGPISNAIQDAADEQNARAQGRKAGGPSQSTIGANAVPITLDVGSHERWQDVTIDAVRRGGEQSTDWSRPSRRKSHLSAFFPAKKKRNAFAIALLLDVSPSCDDYVSKWQALANEFIDEFEEAGLQRIEFVYHTSRVLEEANFTWQSGEGPVEIKHACGGGTSHVDALPFCIALDVDAVVQFTDCETRWPEAIDSEVDVITVVPHGSSRCPFGVNIVADV